MACDHCAKTAHLRLKEQKEVRTMIGKSGQLTKSCAKFELQNVVFELTDNIFEVLTGQILNLVSALELLNAHYD